MRLDRARLAIGLWLGLSAGLTAAGAATELPSAASALKARKLLPSALNELLVKRERLLLAGFQALPAAGDLPSANVVLKQEVTGLNQSLELSKNIDDAVWRFGRVARAVLEAEDFRHFCRGPGAGGYLDDFRQYETLKRPLIVAVFYDYSTSLFVDRDIDAYITGMTARNQAYAQRLLAIYRRGGSSRTFDDLSPAFGLTSFRYSHAITDIANLWLYCWWLSGGDMGGVPFFPFPHRPDNSTQGGHPHGQNTNGADQRLRQK